MPPLELSNNLIGAKDSRQQAVRSSTHIYYYTHSTFHILAVYVCVWETTKSYINGLVKA